MQNNVSTDVIVTYHINGRHPWKQEAKPGAREESAYPASPGAPINGNHNCLTQYVCETLSPNPHPLAVIKWSYLRMKVTFEILNKVF